MTDSSNLDSSFIEWSHLGREDFDQLVELLLTLEGRRIGYRVVVNDGKGGDDGIDVGWFSGDDLVEVYQLKYFPEGFSSSQSKRRKQIRSSFAKPITKGYQHERWTLAVPTKGTPAERKVVSDLTHPEGIRDGEIAKGFLGIPELNALEVMHPQVGRHHKHKQLTQYLASIGMERAALAGPHDLSERLATLAEITDNRSAYWGAAFSVDAAGVSTTTIYPKRADAAVKEPISHHAVFTALDDDQRTLVEEFFHFGVGAELTISRSQITDYRIDGPAWIATTSIPNEITIMRTPGAMSGRPAALRVFPEGEIPIIAHGQVIHHASGTLGASIEFAMNGGVMMTLTFRDLPDEEEVVDTPDDDLEDEVVDAPDDDLDEEVQVRVDIGFVANTAGHSAQEVLAISSALARLEDGHTRAELWIERDLEDPDSESLVIPLPAGREPGENVVPAFIQQLADDLAVISRHTGEIMNIPATMTGVQFAQVRAARLLLEGHVTLLPWRRTFRFDVNRDAGPAALELLRAERGAAMVQFDHVVAPVLDRKIRLPALRIWHPAAEYIDGARIAAAIERGLEEDPPVEVRPLDGEHFVATLSDRGEPRTWNPVSLDLPDDVGGPSTRHIDAALALAERTPET